MNSYSQVPDNEHTKNMFIALVMCALLIMAWQYFIEVPKREKLAEYQRQQQVLKQQQQADAQIAQQKKLDRQLGKSDQASKAPAPRVNIDSSNLQGSFSLKGLRFDELILSNYNLTLDPDSPEVTLLKPHDAETPNFMQFGWLSDDPNLIVPDSNTIWQTNSDTLSVAQPVELTWNNGQGVTFSATISLNDRYMFTIDQQVFNQSGQKTSIKPYALINRVYESPNIDYFILHEGPLAVVEGQLNEIDYSELEEEKKSFADMQGWLGFTDKYWLTTLIPDQADRFTSHFSAYESNGKQRYQADYTGSVATLVDGERSRSSLHFFAGAKEVDILDGYTQGDADIGLKPVPLFDRAVDFGWLYFLTKPIFHALHFFYLQVGNFGVAIIILTICIKLAMFPLANKGYKSMSALKRLQPQMNLLKERYGDDRLKMQQELMALYKKEKVNPASGCLPMLIQLPVFFALYKVLFVTIEMRHAPFFGPWLDLSAMDPTNLFEGFGLFPWDNPSFLHLGILPLLMTITMILQMRMQPTPQDPMQAKIMKFMPWLLLFIVMRMPAGLVLYWVISNILSIAQQWVIMRNYKKENPEKS